MTLIFPTKTACLLLALLFMSTVGHSNSAQAQQQNPRMPTHIGLGGSNTHAGLGVVIGAPLVDSRFGIVAGIGSMVWFDRQPVNPINASVALQYRFTHQWYVQAGYAPIAMELVFQGGQTVENRVLSGPTLISGYDFMLNDSGSFGLSLALGVGAVFRTVESNIWAPASTVGVFWVLTDP